MYDPRVAAGRIAIDLGPGRETMDHRDVGGTTGALRRRFHDATGWVIATVGGIWASLVLPPFALSFALFDPANRSLSANLALFGLAAATVGTVQWLLMLRPHVPGSVWWVLVSAVGGATFWPLYGAIYTWAHAMVQLDILHSRFIYFGSTGYGPPSAISVAIWALQGAACGGAYAAVTGLALVWLLRGRGAVAGATTVPGRAVPSASEG